MKQTSREIVTRAITFESPQRVPRHLWVLPWAEKRYPVQLGQLRGNYPDDIVRPPDVYKALPLIKGSPYDGGTYIDEWGCIFKNVQEGIIAQFEFGPGVYPENPKLAYDEWQKIHQEH